MLPKLRGLGREVVEVHVAPTTFFELEATNQRLVLRYAPKRLIGSRDVQSLRAFRLHLNMDHAHLEL